MTMSMNEKQALYAFGCPNREATVERLRYVAALAPDLETKKLFYTLAVKLSDEDCERWYRCFLNSVRREVIRSRQQSSPGCYSAPIVEGLCE